jgi:hypothetical protein
MDNYTIFTKTAKGLGEAAGKTSALPRDFRKVLKEIDGKSTVGQLSGRLSMYSEVKLYRSLARLLNEDYIREFASAAKEPEVDVDLPLDLKKIADRQQDALTALTMGAFLRELSSQPGAAETVDGSAAAKHGKSQADEKARGAQATEASREQAKAEEARREAQAKRIAEVTERARREAEARKKAEADESARRDADAKRIAEAQEQVRLEAEARKRAEEEEREMR